jgi:hypothetical protein
MIGFTIAVLATFVVLSLGVRRVGVALLGVAWAATALSLGVAGVAVWEMEPNLGPRCDVIGGAFMLAGGGVGLVGLLYWRRAGLWLARAETARALATAHRIMLGLGLGLTLAATLHARGRPAAAPDLAPLVTSVDAPVHNGEGEVAAGGLRTTIEMRRIDPSHYWPDRCFLIIHDEVGGQTYEKDIGSTTVMSGNVSCPRPTRTIDPDRRILYYDDPGFLLATTYAWRFPGFQPTRTTIWTCRRGRLLVVPRGWLDAAWIGLIFAALFEGLAWCALAAARRFDSAREAMHEGAGLLSFADGTRVMHEETAKLPVGPVTLLGGAIAEAGSYRSQSTLAGATILPARLVDLVDRPTRRASFARVLGLLAICLGLAPLVIALGCVLVDF